MLVTSLGDSDVGEFMMVTDLRCWWRNHYVGDIFLYVGDFPNVLYRSPTSQTCHQHIWSTTSVTNIDVAHLKLEPLLTRVTNIDNDADNFITFKIVKN